MVDIKTQLGVLHLKNGRKICVRQILNCKPNKRRGLWRFKKTVDGWVVINDQNLKGKDRVCLRLLQSIWQHGAPPLEEPQNADLISDFELDIKLHNYTLFDLQSHFEVGPLNLFLHGVQKSPKPALCEETQSVTLEEKMTE